MLVFSPAITILLSALSFILVYNFFQRAGTYKYSSYVKTIICIIKEVFIISQYLHKYCLWVLICNNVVLIFVDKESETVQKRPDTRRQTKRNQVMKNNN